MEERDERQADFVSANEGAAAQGDGGCTRPSSNQRQGWTQLGMGQYSAHCQC